MVRVRGAEALTGFLILLPAWASLRGAELNNETQRASPVKPVPSKITGCPAAYMDCGICRCAPATACETGCGNTAVPARLPTSPTSPANDSISTVPSRIPGCPVGYVDCGSCLCTPPTSCPTFCGLSPSPPVLPPVWPGLPFGNGSNLTNGTNGTNLTIVINVTNATNVTNITNITNVTVPQLISRPSQVPYCPQSYVDCGSCVCVPLSTCYYCPGAWSPAPGLPTTPALPAPAPAPPAVVPRPSQVPGCPANYYDCGTCQCVPHSTCQWCPAGGFPVPVRPPSPPTTAPVPSRIPGCPANYYDCGTCQCVPHSTCQWCPGSSVPAPAPVPVPAPVPSPSPGSPVPSRTPGCPANYYDCGYCVCVPRGTCQWCGGFSFVAVEEANHSDDRTLRI